MSHPTNCGFCLSSDLSESRYDNTPDEVPFSVHHCRGCHAMYWPDTPGPKASEEEMVTGWTGNFEDSACFSPFAPYSLREAVAIHANVNAAQWWLG